MVPDFTLKALNTATCVLSAVVLLIQSPQCILLLLLLTLVSLPCDVKFSSFQTDESVFPSVGIRDRVTSVALSLRDDDILLHFGCQKKLMIGQR
jgi:hypothetical protein